MFEIFTWAHPWGGSFWGLDAKENVTGILLWISRQFPVNTADFAEAVAQRCLVKKLLLEILQNS